MSYYGALVFGIGYFLSYLIGPSPFDLVVAIAAGAWGLGVLIGE